MGATIRFMGANKIAPEIRINPQFAMISILLTLTDKKVTSNSVL